MRHVVLEATDTQVLCEKCGWVRRVNRDGGRPACVIGRLGRDTTPNSRTTGVRKRQFLHRDVVGAECEMCGTTEGRLVVDHDHACCPGKYGCEKCIRGTLCDPCNRTAAAFDRARELGLTEAFVAWAERYGSATGTAGDTRRPMKR